MVTEIYPRKGLSVCGNNTIHIVGQNLDDGVAVPVVTIAGKTCAISSHNSTYISCVTPDNPIGDADVIVLLPGRGSSENQNTSVSYSLKVLDFKPKCGSLLGGTMVSIQGEGFCRNMSDVSVKIGEFECLVKSVSSNVINCTTTGATKTVEVDNNGAHKGAFYTH